MSKCEKCRKEVLMPFDCKYCGKIFCEEHRIPESHECPNLPRESPPYIRPVPYKDKTPKAVGYVEHTPESKKMKKKTFQIIKVVVIVSIIIPVAILGIMYIPSLVAPHPRYYSLGEEIRGYPVDELSIKFIYWKTTKQFHELGRWDDARNGNVLIIFNFTIRNIADHELNLLSDDLSLRLGSVDKPLLRYDGYYAQAFFSPVRWLSDLLYGEPWQSLMPNQTTRGIIRYEILEDCQPIELVYPKKDSPQFIIKIS